MNLYQEKDRQYFSWARTELINLVEGKDNLVLEIGCGEGETGLELKRQGKAREVAGIELVPEAAKEAAKKLDKVISGDIEKIDIPFPEEYFDYIIAGDVLEHLYDPWECLKKLRKYLKPGGRVVASIPNIAHWRVLKDLIFRDKWEYVQAGTLDRTHLRFFTKKGIKELFEKGGFEIFYLSNVPSVRAAARLVDMLTLRKLERFLAFQYLVVATKH